MASRLEDRLKALEMQVRALQKELAGIQCRTANPLQMRHGCWLGKTDVDIDKGASGAVSLYRGTALSETDTTVNITAYNKFADVLATKWVIVRYIDGKWYLIAAECE